MRTARPASAALSTWPPLAMTASRASPARLTGGALAVSGRHEEIKRLAHELASYEERAELADEVARLRCRLQEQGR